jgi:hypothetical protein
MISDRYNYLLTESRFKWVFWDGYVAADEISNVQSPYAQVRNVSTTSGAHSKSDFHNFYYDKNRTRKWTGNIHYFDGASTKDWTGVVSAGRTLDDVNLYNKWHILDPLVQRIAMNKFYAKLRQSELQLAVDLAELSKTQTMLQKRINMVLEIARRARKKNLFLYRRDMRRYPEQSRKDAWDSTMAQTWLEMKYGWLPVLSSIHGIADFDRTKAKSFRVRAQHRRRVKGAKQPEIVTSWGFPATAVINADYRCLIICDYRVSNSNAFDLGRLSPLNPVSIAWELVPYSFVVDWFVDIGGYLQNLETAFGQGLTFIRGMEMQMLFCESNSTVKPFKNPIGYSSDIAIN